MEYGHNFIGITRLSEQVLIICDTFLAHYLKSENDMVNLLHFIYNEQYY